MTVNVRKAGSADIPRILEIVQDARESLAKYHVDQWQGGYPDAARFEEDIRLGQCFVLKHGEDIPAFFVLSPLHEPGYDAITDGKWSADIPYCVLHRAAAAVENGYSPRDTDILVQVPGGKLYVRVTDRTVILTGKVQQVFEARTEY